MPSFFHISPLKINYAPRYRHIAASVGHNLYAWGGWTNDIPIDPTTKEAVHVSTEKKKHFSSVVILNAERQSGRQACREVCKQA